MMTKAARRASSVVAEATSYSVVRPAEPMGFRCEVAVYRIPSAFSVLVWACSYDEHRIYRLGGRPIGSSILNGDVVP